MPINSSKFLMSNTDYKKCPAPNRPEYAFIGRSNVGKSSLINMLTERKSLAKVSGRPGKTQLINHFEINDFWYLVDLPGYGYAKISKTLIAKINKIIHSYILGRENLVCLFVLVDCRHEPQKVDMDFMNWLGENGIPFQIVFTKADKLTKTKLHTNLSFYKEELLKTWEELPRMYVTSSSSRLGKDELISFIEETNEELDY
ncbi:YihA family ribosome biogenesis GTP-binding protein [Marinilabiliaceae bacterium JC040]|nr:YihA family ribosome biogenesis GTP-binding protein [Marinilabiliaceae bacterium JC040]